MIYEIEFNQIVRVRCYYNYEKDWVFETLLIAKIFLRLFVSICSSSLVFRVIFLLFGSIGVLFGFDFFFLLDLSFHKVKAHFRSIACITTLILFIVGNAIKLRMVQRIDVKLYFRIGYGGLCVVFQVIIGTLE